MKAIKAKELAEELLKNPDFDVHFSFDERTNGTPFCFRNYLIKEIGDISYSSKIIVLDGEEIE